MCLQEKSSYTGMIMVELEMEMKSSRIDFKKSLRYCRNNELQIRKDLLFSKFNHINKADFWREIRKMKGNIRGP